MVGTLENPTLDLNPALPETLDVITATRSGTATYTDPDGNIATAAADTVRVDYTQGAELTPTKFQNIGYTDFANSYWIARGFTKVGTVDGPLGYTGYEFLENNSNSNPAVYVNSDLSDGSFQTFGVWLKASSPISIALATTGSNRTSTINVTTEWQFFSCTDNTDSNSGPHIGGFATIPYGSGVTLFAAMPQVEEGTTASDFVENTTGSPKFIASATYGPRVPMILVEPSSENLLVESNAFFNSADATKTTGIDAPDGTNTAINIGNILAGTSDRANSSYAIVTGSTDYSGSVYVRGNAGDVVAVYIKRVTGSFVSSPIRHVTLTGDWQRVENINITTLADNTQLRLFVYKDNSVTADSVDLWGGQIEVGSVSTSVIPTSGSTVTRQADDLVISGSDFTDFYNQSEGTFYVESVPNENTSGSFLFDLSFGNASTERLTIYNSGANQKVYIRTSGTTWGDNIIGNRPAGGVISRVAISCKTNNIQASIDGSNMTPDTSATMSTSINKMTIGNRYENPNYFNGRIRRLIFWPYHSDSL
jgi:hypothetical protein